MNRPRLFRWPKLRLLTVAIIISATLPGGAMGANALPLSQIPVPEPPNLYQFVKNKAAAIRLGKALFWDIQASINNSTACASCHYKAGADPSFLRFRYNFRRDTSSTVNAVFNYANSWDGRANNIFNGSSPFGPLDSSAGIWLDNAGKLVNVSVAIPSASLASQAVEIEYLHYGILLFAPITWPEIGAKMLRLQPLAKQFVHPQDSVLGPLSIRVQLPNGSTVSGNRGLDTTYTQMIKDAFQDIYWNSTALTRDGFTQMEANFSLFWGLAIQLYEATLISDQTPFDRYLAGDVNAISPAAQNGFNTFSLYCAQCHSGSEMSNATFSTLAVTGNLVEVDATSVPGAVSDVGFSNIGVRPTDSDIGRGYNDFRHSFAAQAAAGLPYAPFPLPEGSGPNPPVAVNGAFKTPQLRNVELTSPYMHNGSMSTLDEVVDFHVRGGDFRNPELDSQMSPIAPLIGNPTKKAELVEFLKSVTDPRVKNDAEPFDHPELILRDGLTTLPATGSKGFHISVNVTPDKPSPQYDSYAGDITFTASAVGESGSLEYRYWLRNSTSPTWTVVQPYSPKPSWTWKTTTVANGSYYIQVDVRTAGLAVSRESQANLTYRIIPDAVTGVTLSPDHPHPQAPGTAVLFTAAASGGSGTYEYRFWLKTSTNWKIVQDFSATPTWTWNTTGAIAGSYGIQVDARNAGTVVPDIATVLSYRLAFPPPKGVTITTSPRSPQAPGTPIAVTATGSGGAGSYEYRFWLKTATTWTMVRDFSTSPIWNWAAPAAGSYAVQVDVRNSGSTSPREAASVIPFVVATSPGSYSISGTVTSSGKGLQRVTVALNNSFATTTDASGNFIFTGLANGSYTIIPRKDHDALNYAFNPIKSTQTISNSNITGINFTAINLAPFKELAKAADCSNMVNRLLLIDNQMVFWDRQGQCSDNAYSGTLFADAVTVVLCDEHDSIAGPVRSCREVSYQTFFDSIMSNLDKPDLGLGSAHTVEQIAF